MLEKFIYFYNRWSLNQTPLLSLLVDRFLFKTIFLKRYYLINDLIWQDGFLIDFLQKKVVDKWIRKFLILSAYLFNERLVFDMLIKFYIDTVLWSGQRFVIFEFTNVASLLFITLFALVVIFLLINLCYIGLLIY